MRIFLRTALFIALSATLNSLFAQNQDIVFKPIKPKPTYKTSKITNLPKIDGIPNDECWKSLPIATDFIAFEPKPNTPSDLKTEVRVGYDDNAIYLCAYLYDDPNKILHELGQRDQVEVAADFFNFSLDTYNDDQSAQRFGVTAAGVQADSRIAPGSQNVDFNWDVVWESAVTIQADGWVVEYRIPYSALRFPKKKTQQWGVQFTRITRRTGEQATWSQINPKESGFVQFYGDLEGIENIEPPLRLSFSPYIAGTVSRDPTDNGYTNSRSFNGGLDLKYGLNESFTLDMTLIPNFGQVQSDNKQLNLSPFEVRFDERRPFFTESTDLFTMGDLFYSRRLGGTPTRYYDVGNQLGVNEVVKKNPSETQLYNATKLSGRTNGNLAIGVLNAVAAPMYAEIENELTGTKRTYQTSVLTNYNIFTIQKVLKNNSDVSFTNASTLRQGDERDANVSALRFKLRDKKNKYELQGVGRLSQIFEVNKATSVGKNFAFGGGKVSGNFVWGGGVEFTDDKWDPNDLNIFTGNNLVSTGLNIGYNTYEPKGVFLQTQSFMGVNYNQRYKPFLYADFGINQGVWAKFKNQSTFNYNIFSMPFWYYDYFEPRVNGRRYYHNPFAFINLNYGTDSRKTFYSNFNLAHGNFLGKEDGAYTSISVNPNWRVSNRFNLAWNLRFDKDQLNYGYVSRTSDDVNAEITFGGRGIKTIINTLSMSYKFDATNNITFRARHYWRQLVYKGFYELQLDGTLKPKAWANTDDLNYNLFNIDMVYNRQIAPGSFLNIIWKNNIFNSDQSDQVQYQGYGYNFQKTLEAPESNSLTIKLIYYFDYLNLKQMAKRWN
ncbi:MAG: hypothetical protein RLZZ628_1083 [Bacteroidota bacterium]|jgi:hypothetical protein